MRVAALLLAAALPAAAAPEPVETVAAQPSWIVRTREVELAVTSTTGQRVEAEVRHGFLKGGKL